MADIPGGGRTVIRSKDGNAEAHLIQLELGISSLLRAVVRFPLSTFLYQSGHCNVKFDQAKAELFRGSSGKAP